MVNNISVSVKAGDSADNSTIMVTGGFAELINDDGVRSFGIGGSALSNAQGKYWGKVPDESYLKSPTPPYGDFYLDFNWPQVNQNVTPIQSSVLSVDLQPIIVKTQTFTNKSSFPATFNAAISDMVSNTSTSMWNTGGTLMLGQSIEYGVDFILDGKSTTSLSYSQDWGVGGSNSTTYEIGSSSGVSVMLDPGKSVIANLTASRGTLKAKVVYNTTLSGYSIANYHDRYKDHFIWALDINAVLDAGGIPKEIRSEEVIEISYYSNATVELVDPETNEIMFTVAL